MSVSDEKVSESRPCKKCGIKIHFIKGPSGNIIPMQQVRTVYFVDDNKVRSATAKGFSTDAMYVSHFETCPNASSFSKGKR